MQRPHIYLSHPQVVIDPNQDITRWGLNPEGQSRVAALAASGVLTGIEHVFSSAETKAVETATPLAQGANCDLIIRPDMHENDRQATGFLPPDQFEATADQFFQHPDQSIKGWETAIAAQTRIVREVETCVANHPNRRLLFVGHGAVGTLLYCHLAGLPISRAHDQPYGGGCFFAFDTQENQAPQPWQVMENLYT